MWDSSFHITPPPVQHYRAWYMDNVVSDPFSGSMIDSGTILQIDFASTQNIGCKVRISLTYILYFDIVSSWCKTWVFSNRYKKCLSSLRTWRSLHEATSHCYSREFGMFSKLQRSFYGLKQSKFFVQNEVK